jgi:hypothetical protein
MLDLTYSVVDADGRLRATLDLDDGSRREFDVRVGERLVVRA